MLEIVESFQGDAYRAVYTIRFSEAVYVLHAFKKKSTRGIATPKSHIDLIKQRLKAVEARRTDKGLAMTDSEFIESSGNVFADLGLPDAGTRLAKAELARRIAAVIDALGLTQREAAEMMGIDQPKVSAITRGRLADFSLERLMTLINRMGLDIEIAVSANAEPSRPAHLVVLGKDGSPAPAGAPHQADTRRLA